MHKKIITTKMLAAFEKRLRMDERSESTISKYMHDIRCFTSFARDEPVTKDLTLSYKADLKKRFALSSANSMIAALNSFLRYFEWEDCCVRQFKVQRKIYCSSSEELSKEEYLRLVKTAAAQGNERLCLILQTICGTGIRISELPYITVDAVLKGEAVVSCKNKARTVFIVRALRKKLLKYIKKHHIVSGSVFITRTKKPISRCNIWREMKSLCALANVVPEKVFPHNLRHLFARVFYNLEKDIVKLADVLGHFSINTTRIYIMSSGAEHKQRLELMRLIV